MLICPVSAAPVTWFSRCFQFQRGQQLGLICQRIRSPWGDAGDLLLGSGGGGIALHSSGGQGQVFPADTGSNPGVSWESNFDRLGALFRSVSRVQRAPGRERPLARHANSPEAVGRVKGSSAIECSIRTCCSLT